MPEFLLSSSTGLKLTVSQVVKEVIRFMLAEPKHQYKITIGTDSEQFGENGADFVTAIVVHRVGNGGRYFWRRLDLAPFHTLRDRIIKEVLISLDVAKGVLEELRKQSAPQFEFEIHADIGEHGPTRDMLQEVVGMIRAYNFEAKTKPESYAASHVADRHT